MKNKLLYLLGFNLLYVILIICPIFPYLSSTIDIYKLLWVLLFMVIFDSLVIYKIVSCKENVVGDYKAKNIIIAILRIIAPLSVLIVHIGYELDFSGRIYENTLNALGHGPEIFMLLSGYLIMFSLSRDEKWKNFYIKRAFKIVPLYYFMIISAMIYINKNNIKIPYDRLGWTRYFLFISTVVPADDEFWVNFVATWTISSFVFFYLMCPIIKKYFNSYKRSIILCIVSLFVSTVYWIIAYFFSVESHKYLYNPIWYLCYFMVGVALFYARREKKEKEFTITMGLIVGIAINLTDVWAFAVTSRMIWCALVALLLIYVKDDIIKSEKAKRKICEISNYGYSLYIVHPLLIYIFPIYKGYYSSNFTYIVALLIVLLVIVYVSHNLIEIPFSKLGDKLAGH